MKLWVAMAVSVIACACDSSESSGSSEPGEGGQGGGSTTSSTSASSSSTSGGSVGPECAALCATLSPVCPSDDDAACGATCQASLDGPCSAEWSAVADCLQSSPLSCNGNKPSSDTCTAEAFAFIACEENGGTTAGLCYANQGECNPMAHSCGPGATCDVAFGESFKCFPPPNDVPPGGSCGNPPYCQDGSFCYVENGTCYSWCCTDDDCPMGKSCVPFDFGTGVSIEIKGCIGF